MTNWKLWILYFCFCKTQCQNWNFTYISAPCLDGQYRTDTGCVQCEENTYIEDGAESCTECPGDKTSKAGSTSESDCYGKPLIIFANSAQ